MLRINNVSKSFLIEGEQHKILKDINLEIEDSRSICILGKSGSGKSTLLSTLAGLLTPETGEISFDGQNITSLSEEQRTNFRMNNIGFIFQDFKLITHLTVLENVLLPLELKKINDRENIAIKNLNNVGLGHRKNAFPDTLSGGEKQRVAMARALAINAKIILADEPNANLDIETGKQVIDYLFKLKEELGQTLLLVTHDEELSKRCDEIYRLEDGVLKKQ